MALLLLLSFILPFLPPKTFSVLSVLNLGVSFLILSNALFVVYWLIRLKRVFLLSLIILIIGYLAFGSLYKFSGEKKIEQATNFKVMNYNVRLFNLYKWIPDAGIETKIINFIEDESPEILCLQEYHPHKNIDLSFFKYKYEHLSGEITKYGQAIFSQFPIINSGSIEFPDTANNAIYADIVNGEDTIRVYNVHLESLHINTKIESLKKENSERLFKRIGSTFTRQQFQTELFLKHKAQCKHKVVICGDINNTSFSYVYRMIKKDLNDTFMEAGTGFGSTYNFKFFPVRIDCVFSDLEFTVNGFKTFKIDYYDHYPVMATLSLDN